MLAIRSGQFFVMSGTRRTPKGNGDIGSIASRSHSPFVVNAVNAERQWRQFARFEEVFLGHFVVNVMNVVNAESEWRQLFAALCLLFCQRGERGERRKARVASPMVNAEREWRPEFFAQGPADELRHVVVNAVNAERQWRRGGGQEWFGEGDFGRERGERRKAMEDP